MSILSLGQIAANQSSLYKLSQKASTAVSDVSKAAESSAVDTATQQDSATVSAQRAQAKVTSFREAAQGAAKNLAQVAFALRGTDAMSAELTDLKTLARKALENPLDAKNLEKLNKAIKAGRSNLDQIALKNQFPQAAVSNPSGAPEGESQAILPELNGEVLLGKNTPITSEADLRNFLTTVENSATQIRALHQDVKEMMHSYENMALHFEISMENQQAANSIFPQQTGSVLDALFGNSNQALFAQGNRLSPQIMNLI